MKNLSRNLLGRIWFYARIGWGNYIAWWLSALAYVTIIYVYILQPFLAASASIYVIIFTGIMVLSLVVGYAVTKLKLYGVELEINTEVNPYINRLIGKKEILGWRAAIESTKTIIVFYKKHRIDTKNLEKVLREQEAMLKEAREAETVTDSKAVSGKVRRGMGAGGKYA